MISQDISSNKTKIGPNKTKIGSQNGLECVRSVDSGQSVEVIHITTNNINNFIVWLEPIERYDGLATSGYLKVISYKEGVGGEIQGMSVYREPYRQNRIFRGRNGKS